MCDGRVAVLCKGVRQTSTMSADEALILTRELPALVTLSSGGRAGCDRWETMNASELVTWWNSPRPVAWGPKAKSLRYLAGGVPEDESPIAAIPIGLGSPPGAVICTEGADNSKGAPVQGEDVAVRMAGAVIGTCSTALGRGQVDNDDEDDARPGGAVCRGVGTNGGLGGIGYTRTLVALGRLLTRLDGGGDGGRGERASFALIGDVCVDEDRCL